MAFNYPFPYGCARFERPWCPWCASGSAREVPPPASTSWPIDPWSGKPLCVHLGPRDRYGWPLTVVQCEGCGLIYSRECWTHDGARKFYAEHYRPLVNAWHQKPEGYDWRAESKAHLAPVIDVLLPHGAVTPMLNEAHLDVGAMGASCGVGPEANGILWETYDLDGEAYPVVTCVQTFDHLIDPRVAWDKFAQATAPGGYLYVDVVDPHAILQRGGNPWKSDHTLYITPRVLRAMADPALWDVQATGYLPDGVHYFGLWRRK